MLYRKAAIRRLLIFVAMAWLTGCSQTGTIRQISGMHELSAEKAVMVGLVVEGFLTRPHGLEVFLEQRQPEGKPVLIKLHTLDWIDEMPASPVRGHLFMYEVPPGRYELSNWRYDHFSGDAALRDETTAFELQAGQIAYLGDFQAIGLTMCLSVIDHYDDTVPALRDKYINLRDREIINLAKDIAFDGWAHVEASDVFGKGLCQWK